MIKQSLKTLIYSCCLAILFFVSFFIFSSSGDKLNELEFMIKDFSECLSSEPEEIDYKLCGAYVAWSKNKEQLISCLKNGVIDRKEPELDQNGNILEINIRMKCDSTRIVSIRFKRSKETEEYLITWVGEIVD